jgi:hypothetical protein
MLMGLDMKVKEWERARKRLKVIYKDKGITRCEVCGSSWWITFHHLNKRSSGKAKNTFEDTRLLCIKCHMKADGDRSFNKSLWTISNKR